MKDVMHVELVDIFSAHYIDLRIPFSIKCLKRTKLLFLFICKFWKIAKNDIHLEVGKIRYRYACLLTNFIDNVASSE